MKKSGIVFVLLIIMAATGFAWYYTYGPCGTKSVQEAFILLDEKLTNYQNALDVARNTPQDSLAPHIAGLQERKRHTLRLEVPSCTENAHKYLVLSMEANDSGVLAILKGDSPTIVDEKFGIASGYLDEYYNEADRISECAPFCK